MVPILPQQQPLLIEDVGILEQLGRIVVRLTSNTALRDDLMQEALIHLWQVQLQTPGQTKNWYVQNCRYHLLHYLALGRSVDSPKRRGGQITPADQQDDADDWLNYLEADSCVLQDVSARDIMSALEKSLSARQLLVLQWLAEGVGTREIAKRLSISHPMVVKHRRKIAALARKLAIEPLAAEAEEPCARSGH